ncbi:hypothetical protein GCM10019815_20270 [Pediococcus damnosus]
MGLLKPRKKTKANKSRKIGFSSLPTLETILLCSTYKKKASPKNTAEKMTSPKV